MFSTAGVQLSAVGAIFHSCAVALGQHPATELEFGLTVLEVAVAPRTAVSNTALLDTEQSCVPTVPWLPLKVYV